MNSSQTTSTPMSRISKSNEMTN